MASNLVSTQEFTAPTYSNTTGELNVVSSTTQSYENGAKSILDVISSTAETEVPPQTIAQTQAFHHQEIVGIDGNPLLSLPSNNRDTNITSVTDSNGAIYLLVSNDSNNHTVLQTVESNQQGDCVFSSETLKTSESSTGTTVQIMNSDGVPVNINVNELLSTITDSKTSSTSSSAQTSGANILSLSSSIISTTETSGNRTQMSRINQRKSNKQYILKNVLGESPSLAQLSNIPNWALHLRDCTLFGDTYTGYVTNEVEMDAVLNLYKKETQSLFAIRQTPSPAKDETNETVRLMWKSQYVPYDGIPFVNVGRRATVMECEYGPRKRSNALKRMIQLHGHKNAMKKIPNLTCPARLFVKKVRKFPQFCVPLDADAKLVRQLQEQSLKLVRQAGFKSGEIRLYMQLPLPTAHRYHNIGSSIDTFQRELLEDSDEIIIEPIAVDGRVLDKIQELVRQGYSNPFTVRAAVKDYVENKMQINVQETRPYKHNKAFYPPLIEIQNIIQQTEVALNSGILTPLPVPVIPPVPTRPKRKRTASIEMPNSPLMIKRIKVDATQDGGIPVTSCSDTMINQATMQDGNCQRDDGSNILSSLDPSETISLTLTDSQLENFSVQNFTYEQLSQLAKIGLLALNNAAKDPTDEEDVSIETNSVLDNLNVAQDETDGSKLSIITSNHDDINTLATNLTS